MPPENKNEPTAPATEVKAAAKKDKRPPFEVAPGCAVTTRRGVLGAGAAIEAKDLADGDAGVNSLDALVKAKKIVKN